MKKKQKSLKKLKARMDERCISLNKFLMLYCGIYNEDLYNLKLSHDDIKEILPKLRRTSFDFLLSNGRDFYVGNVIPVKDSFGCVVPYITPTLDNFISEDCCDFGEYKDVHDEKLEKVIISEELSKYELIELCRYYSFKGKINEYRIAHRILKRK